MDCHWSRVAPLPRSHQGSKQRASTPLQKLDISLGPVVLCRPQLVPRVGTRLEQLQSVLQRGVLCQPLRGVADHVGHVSGMEGTEAYKGREFTRNGSRDGYVSS